MTREFKRLLFKHQKEISLHASIDNPLNSPRVESINSRQPYIITQDDDGDRDRDRDREVQHNGKVNKDDHIRKLVTRIRDILTKPENTNTGGGPYDLKTVHKKINVFLRDKANLPSVKMESLRYTKLISMSQSSK